jgi:hypothetical protein
MSSGEKDIVEKFGIILRRMSENHNIPTLQVRIKITNRVGIAVKAMNLNEPIKDYSLEEALGLCELSGWITTMAIKSRLKSVFNKYVVKLKKEKNFNATNENIDFRIYTEDSTFRPKVIIYHNEQPIWKIEIEKLVTL